MTSRTGKAQVPSEASGVMVICPSPNVRSFGLWQQALERVLAISTHAQHHQVAQTAVIPHKHHKAYPDTSPHTDNYLHRDVLVSTEHPRPTYSSVKMASARRSVALRTEQALTSRILRTVRLLVMVVLIRSLLGRWEGWGSCCLSKRRCCPSRRRRCCCRC